MFWKRCCVARAEKDPLIKCPRCAVIMKKKTRGDVTIDVCPTCGGLWLDDKEIDKLVAVAAANAKNVKETKIKKK